MLLGPYDGRVDVFSTGIMAAELVVRYMDIAGFGRVAATQYSLPEHRVALVEDACARLDSVCPSLSAVVRGCCAVMPSDRMHSDAALLALSEIDVGRRRRRRHVVCRCDCTVDAPWRRCGPALPHTTDCVRIHIRIHIRIVHCNRTAQ